MADINWSQLDTDNNGSVDIYEFRSAFDVALSRFEIVNDQVISNGNAVSRKDYKPLSDKKYDEMASFLRSNFPSGKVVGARNNAIFGINAYQFTFEEYENKLFEALGGSLETFGQKSQPITKAHFIELQANDGRDEAGKLTRPRFLNWLNMKR